MSEQDVNQSKRMNVDSDEESINDPRTPLKKSHGEKLRKRKDQEKQDALASNYRSSSKYERRKKTVTFDDKRERVVYYDPEQIDLSRKASVVLTRIQVHEEPIDLVSETEAEEAVTKEQDTGNQIERAAERERKQMEALQQEILRSRHEIERQNELLQRAQDQIAEQQTRFNEERAQLQAEIANRQLNDSVGSNGAGRGRGARITNPTQPPPPGTRYAFTTSGRLKYEPRSIDRRNSTPSNRKSASTTIRRCKRRNTNETRRPQKVRKTFGRVAFHRKPGPNSTSEIHGIRRHNLAVSKRPGSTRGI